AAIAAGQYVFGENTAQEALTKIPHFNDHAPALAWHFIGHLQSNKAKLVPGNFCCMHSLDSLALAQRLSRLAHEQGAQLDLLIEVNIAGDTNKHGIAARELFALMDQLMKEPLP